MIPVDRTTRTQSARFISTTIQAAYTPNSQTDGFGFCARHPTIAFIVVPRQLPPVGGGGGSGRDTIDADAAGPTRAYNDSRACQPASLTKTDPNNESIMNPALRPRPIFIVSDGTGETAEKVVRAGLLQFRGYLVHLQLFPTITEAEELEPIFLRARDADALLVTTLVRTEMRTLATELAEKHRIRMVDLLGNLLGSLGRYLGVQPEGIPGRMHQADADYFRRVEAVEFTVKADDGKEPRLLRKADIILVGVSRTSKTPLSVFLALKGFRVSNVPIVLEQDPPEELYRLDQRRVFGLTIDPESLRDIRRERLETMRVASRTNYDDMDYILAELEWCEDIFRRHPEWPVIDVTRRAVEETAANILRIMGERGLGRDVGEVGQL